jgi:hypothetical protein
VAVTVASGVGVAVGVAVGVTVGVAVTVVTGVVVSVGTVVDAYATPAKRPPASAIVAPLIANVLSFIPSNDTPRLPH